MNPVPRQGNASAIDESLLLVEIVVYDNEDDDGNVLLFAHSNPFDIYREIISNEYSSRQELFEGACLIGGY